MKICHFCGNKNFKKNSVQYTYKRDNKFIIVNNVPCEQCEFCGEQYFAADVLKRIEAEYEAVYFKGKPVKEELVIPVESYSDIFV